MALAVSAFPTHTTEETSAFDAATPRFRSLFLGAPFSKSDHCPVFSDSLAPNGCPPFDHTIASLQPPPFSSSSSAAVAETYPQYLARMASRETEPPRWQALTRKRSFPFTYAVLSPLPHHSSPHTATSPVRIPTRHDAAVHSHSTSPRTAAADSSQPQPPPQPPSTSSSHLPSPNSPSGDLATPNISAVPTLPEPAPSRSPAASISPARPTITINTSILWNTPSSSSSQQLMQQQHPPSQRPPASRILIAGPRAGNSNPQSGINLRYQSMAIVDPTASDKVSSSRMAKAEVLPTPHSSTRYKPPTTRVRRPRTSPGPGTNLLEAIPNSWASASRPSDLRPLYPSKAQQPCSLSALQGVRTPINSSPPPPVHPRSAPLPPRSRSRSITKRESGEKNERAVMLGPRPRQAPTQPLVQPTPKRLSLGMVMNTTKLVSASPPPTSNLGPSLSKPILTATTMMATTKVLPIRGIPASPSPSSLHSRSPPHSHSDFRASYKPTGSPLLAYSPAPRSIPSSPSFFSASPPRPLPVIAINSATTPSSGTSPPSGISSYSPPSLTSTTGSKGRQRSEGETDPLHSSLDSLLNSSDGEGDAAYPKPDTHDIHYISDSHHHHYQQQPQHHHDQLKSDLDYADEVEVGGQYNDKLLRVPISPSSATFSSGDLVVEVFVDNQYCEDDFDERGPSPIVYARHGGGVESDEDEETPGSVTRRGLTATAAAVTAAVTTPMATAAAEQLEGPSSYGQGQERLPTFSSPSSRLTSAKHRQKYSKKHKPSSPISYHSDDSSLFHGAYRPRRRRRSQLRSYRYLYQPPVSPNQDAGGGGGGGATLGVQVIESPRSPSPILYAPRRSLDFLYDDEDEDEDEQYGYGYGDGEVGEWSTAGYLWEQEGGTRRVRKRTQPSSFLYEYSTPPDVKDVGRGRDENERERGRESERVGNKDREREKGKSRKGSRGLLDELAAVAALNVVGGKKMGGTAATTATSRSRSPRSKNEKEGQWRKWKRDREKDRRHVESSSSGEGMFLYQEVLDIASRGNERQSGGNDLAGLEFAP